MGKGKRQRDDDNEHGDGGSEGGVMSKLNSSLSSSRGSSNRPQNTHNNNSNNQHRNSQQQRGNHQGSNKFAKRDHQSSRQFHHNNETTAAPVVQPFFQPKPQRQHIIKPTFKTHIDSNEFGRDVRMDKILPTTGIKLYAKNFVPTIDANPHIEQIRGGIVTVLQETDLKRTLVPDAPRMPYRRRRGEVKSVVHWGQRKLMISEIEFLTMYGEDNITVVYAGSAPGTHIPFLSKLFPTVNFVLVDPSDFHIEATNRITLRKEFMTEAVAQEFVGQKTLLISDIRSGDFKVMSNEDMEAAVKRDMDWQMQWHLIMKPVAGMFKFRLPWAEGQTEYLQGDIYLPVWGPQTTTEARLITTSYETQLWDNRGYEEQMFYFNNVTRCCLYHHDIAASGLDHCYDCSSEVHVLKKYLHKHFRAHFSRSKLSDLGETDVNRKISQLVDSLTVECGGSPDGRNLLNWQKRFNPASMKAGGMGVPKEFDVDNLKIIKLTPEEIKANADIVRMQNANAIRILQHAYQSKLSQYEGWCALPEVIMEDIGWNAGKSSAFGGAFIPAKTAADAWLWGMLGELSGVVAPWTTAPFGVGSDNSAVSIGVSIATNEAVASDADEVSMMSTEVSTAAVGGGSHTSDAESAEAAQDMEATEEDEQDMSESRAHRLPEVVEHRIDVNEEAQTILHQSIFCNEALKFEIFHQIWAESGVDSYDHDWLKAEGLHKVLILLTKSGGTYMFCPEVIGSNVAKFTLPSLAPEQCHLTVLLGLLDFQKIEKPKRLHLVSVYSRQGHKVVEKEQQAQQALLAAFVQDEFNFQSTSRALVLTMNGFEVVDSI